MATKTVIKRREKAAIDSLVRTLDRISKAVGVESVDVAGISYRRDPDYGEMLRFEAIADWVRDIDSALSVSRETPSKTAGKGTRKGSARKTTNKATEAAED